MRFILLITFLIVGMLYSAEQKQIIIGTFSIENNAVKYSKKVKKMFRDDVNLNRLMKKYSLKVEYTLVGEYNVVNVFAFSDKDSITLTLKELRKHFPEAYPISYPAKLSSKKNKPIEKKEVKKAIAEKKVIKAPIEEVVEVKSKKMEEKVIEQKVQKPEAVKEELKYVAPVINKPMLSEASKVDDVQIPFSMIDVLLIVSLLLVIIAYVLYKKKERKIDED